jgi:hypothetical protein
MNRIVYLPLVGLSLAAKAGMFRLASNILYWGDD